MSRASFGKREREQAKRDKAANKRERRQRAADEASTATDADGATDAAAADDGVSTADLLQMIEDVHRRHESGDMTDDDFETTKADLLGRLRVD